jgi:UDP-glucose 4-epimerase
VETDLTSSPTLRRLIGDCDYVFHLAAQVGNLRSIADPVGDARNNVLGTVCLLEAARGARISKLVYSASSAGFGEARVLPIDEDHLQRPASFYALSKAVGENYVSLAADLLGIPGVCLRYFNVYGLPLAVNEYSGVINIFFDRLRAGMPLTIYGDGSQLRDFVHVRDVVQANLLAALSPARGAFNIGTGTGTSIHELANSMAVIVGTRPNIEFAPARAGEVQRSVAAIEKARAELGYEPAYDLRKGLADVWAHLSTTGERVATIESSR